MLDFLIGTLGVSLLGSLLTGKGVKTKIPSKEAMRASEGNIRADKWMIRAGEGTIRAGQDL